MMKAIATKSASSDTSTKSAGVKPRHTPGPKSVPVAAGTNTFIQTKSICPCDGGCPKCTGIIQPKLTIGQPNDRYEQEADRIADQIMRMPKPEGSLVQRKSECSGCREEEEESVQLKSSTDKSPPVSAGLQSQIQSMRGNGQPLPESTCAFFEPRFGQDFSQVRVHTDAKAADAAKSINSKAFTSGKDIAFGAGQYSPESAAGKRLLGHELTHVTQQLGGQAPQMVQRRVDNPEPPASVIHDRIDVRAQFAFLRLFKRDSPEDRKDAIELFYKVDSGEIKGIYGDDLAISAQLAKKRNTVRWKLHEIGEPKGGDAVWIEDDAPDAKTDTPVIIFREVAGKKPRLDNALLMVYRYHKKKKPSIFKPPHGNVPPYAEMKGEFLPVSVIWNIKENRIWIKLPSSEVAIGFEAIITGSKNTRGAVFYVQNMMYFEWMSHLQRGNKSKSCQLKKESQLLDTQYPYEKDSIAVFNNEEEKRVTINASDQLSTPGHVCEPYKTGDIMSLVVSEKFRMFLVWDPYLTKKPESAQGAHPISLGYVDWGMKEKAEFEMYKKLPDDTDLWKKTKSSKPDELGGGDMVRTPNGEFIEISDVSSGEKIEKEMDEECCPKELK